MTGNLYGLPEAGRYWYEKLVNIFDKIGLQPCKADPCMFVNKKDNEFVTVGMYVDDGIIVSECEELINKLILQLNKEVKNKELKEKIKFPGIDIGENNGRFLLGYEISKFSEKILERFDLENCKSVKTPSVSGINLDDYENENKIDATLYQEMLGEYLVRGMRPDLAVIISNLSQYAKDPRIIHLQAVKGVLRYNQGTKNYKLRNKNKKGQ